MGLGRARRCGAEKARSGTSMPLIPGITLSSSMTSGSVSPRSSAASACGGEAGALGWAVRHADRSRTHHAFADRFTPSGGSLAGGGAQRGGGARMHSEEGAREVLELPQEAAWQGGTCAHMRGRLGWPEPRALSLR